MVNFKKKVFYIIFILLFSIIILFILNNFCFALGEPKIVTKINSAFENIESWILKLSTPAAAVAVGKPPARAQAPAALGLFGKRTGHLDSVVKLCLPTKICI